MLWDLVNLMFGGIPEQFEFVKIFGIFFVMYIFLSLFKLFIDVIRSFMRSLR